MLNKTQLKYWWNWLLITETENLKLPKIMLWGQSRQLSAFARMYLCTKTSRCFMWPEGYQHAQVAMWEVLSAVLKSPWCWQMTGVSMAHCAINGAKINVSCNEQLTRGKKLQTKCYSLRPACLNYGSNLRINMTGNFKPFALETNSCYNLKDHIFTLYQRI